MNQATRSRVFYEKFPLKLGLGVIGNAMLLVYFFFLIRVFRLEGFPLLIVIVMVAWSSLFFMFLVSNVFSIIFRPMLTVNDNSLNFRSISIPWDMVSDLTPVRTAQGRCLGIVLDHSAQEYVANELIPKPFSKGMFRWFVRRYGTLPVPRAKDADIDELRVIIDHYRQVPPEPNF